MIVLYVLVAIPVAAVVLLVGYWAYLRLRYLPIERDWEVHSVPTADGWRISLFRIKPAGGEPGEPILMCHGAFTNHLNFAVPEGHCLADYLSESGYDCWLMDYRGDRSAMPPDGISRNSATLDQYLEEDIPAAVSYIKSLSGFEQVHGVGHSLGGMLLYAYDLSFEDADLASLTTLGSPVGFEPIPHKRLPWLVTLIRIVPWLCAAIQRMSCEIVPKRKISNAAIPINWENTPDTVNSRVAFHALELLPAPVADSLDRWAADNDWVMLNGDLDVVSSLPFLSTPLFAVYAEKDRLTRPDYVQAFFDGIKERDKKILFLSKAQGHSADYDHIDLVFGHEAANEVFLPIREWIEAHPAERSVDAGEILDVAPSRPEVVARPTKPGPADLFLLDDDEDDDLEAVEVVGSRRNAKAKADEAGILDAQRKRLGRVMEDMQAAFQGLDEIAAAAGTKSASTVRKRPAAKKSAPAKKPAAKTKAGGSGSGSKSGGAGRKSPSKAKTAPKKKDGAKPATKERAARRKSAPAKKRTAGK